MSELPPLLTLTDLPDGLGKPSQRDLDVISDDIRRVCGWHIAPRITQTIVIDSDGSGFIPLPTLALHRVTSVKYWRGTEFVPVPGWDSTHGWTSRACGIFHPIRFPRGARMLQVEFEHGHEKVPPSLVQGLVSLISGPPVADIASESLPGHSVTYRANTAASATANTLAMNGALTSFKLGWRL